VCSCLDDLNHWHASSLASLLEHKRLQAKPDIVNTLLKRQGASSGVNSLALGWGFVELKSCYEWVPAAAHALFPLESTGSWQDA
jgi:hypothetical protein